MKAYLRNVVLGIAVGLAIGMSLGSVRGAKAHDHDHPELDAWYAGLMQPDNPTVSCCGIADSYFCDIIHVREEKTYCTITDDRPDEPLHREHVDIGTEILIPDYKLTWKYGNPVGHALVFLSSARYVWCFIQNGGV